MNKLSGALIASLLAMAIDTAAYSADPDNSKQFTQDGAPRNQIGPATVTEPLDPPLDSTANAAAGTSNRDAKGKDDYQAKLKRCEGLGSPGARKECADNAKKEHGQM
jgi:hypothetical protein